MKPLIEQIAALTDRDEPFVLATVTARDGSAPRSTGARMLVRGDGVTYGTVGGGNLEAQVKHLAQKALITHRSLLENFQFSGKDASEMDAICGGQVDVLVEWIDAADPAWKSVVANIVTSFTRRAKAWLLTEIPEKSSSDENQSLTHLVIQKDENSLSSLPPGLSPEPIVSTLQPNLLSVAGRRWMVEPLETGGVVYIFGAGHVGRSLSFFTQAVGFRTIVLDDRQEYANTQRIPTADEVIVLDSFEGAFANLSIDTDSFIVIVTRGHLNDQVVLAQALKTNAGYIGMIGSRRKCALVFDSLRENGFHDADIQRVHAPIGLSIRAETPEEIGVSITAEMIQVRAELINPMKYA